MCISFGDDKNPYTVKPVLSDHSKIGKMKVLKTGGSLLQVNTFTVKVHALSYYWS